MQDFQIFRSLNLILEDSKLNLKGQLLFCVHLRDVSNKKKSPLVTLKSTYAISRLVVTWCQVSAAKHRLNLSDPTKDLHLEVSLNTCSVVFNYVTKNQSQHVFSPHYYNFLSLMPKWMKCESMKSILRCVRHRYFPHSPLLESAFLKHKDLDDMTRGIFPSGQEFQADAH